MKKPDEIKCRILGTAPGKPESGKNQASVWVKIDSGNFLIDCGEGTAQQLLKYELDGDVLDAVIITHYHPDHVSGLFLVLQMLYLQNRTKPLNIYLPERVPEFGKILEFFYIFERRFQYRFKLSPIEELNNDYSTFKIILNNHLTGYEDIVIPEKLDNKMKAWSILIDTGKESVLYTSDFYDGLSEKIVGCDYLIADAIHPTVEEIMKLADKTKYQVILNHGISEALETELKKISANRFVIAQDGYLVGE